MDKGFTLIEVLVALVILSITFLWLLNAESQGINMAIRSRFLTTSSLLAQERISDVTSGIRVVSPGESQGDFGEDFKGYTYQEKIETTPLTGYLKYSLTVKWGGGGSPLESKFISFLASK
ncbi:MAG TPA: prepilin-type N-terminal cleavage/methylation domain-containing protein [Desulfomonilia bacterium]|nr:prepilin-type N-terminal cleavage/methylation domain-containing protein [Desulfomonilia bacterium]